MARDDRYHPAVEVAEVVRQVGVVHLREPTETELAVAGERTLAQEVIAERLGAELRDDVHRLDDVAERLADLLGRAGLLVLDVDEAVAEYMPRRLDVSREAHRRPQRTVEARDVLADEVNVGRPPFAETLLVAAVADGGDVIQQCIEPDVDGELRIKRDRNAPILSNTADVNVLKAALDVGQHLITATLRLDKVRILLVEAQQLILELRLREVVARLAATHRRHLCDRDRRRRDSAISFSVLNDSHPSQYSPSYVPLSM